MPKRKRITAISLFISGLLLLATIAFADQAGVVTHLSGPLALHKSDGAVNAISIGSKIYEGDTVIAEKRTYARLKFIDGSEVTLKPSSQFKVEKYSFDKEKPTDDNASYRLIKGGLRTITGQIGKRGNQDSYQMKTPTATIGIRGTIYDAQYCQEGSCGTNKSGLYLEVINGTVVITNDDGIKSSLLVSTGQYAYVYNSATPPVVLPLRPNIPFSPPPSLKDSSTGSKENQSKSSSPTECQVK